MIKKIEINSKLGSVLMTADAGRDLFINVLELYLEGDRDETIELDFRDVMTISPKFFESFISTSKESKQLPISKLRQQVIFSGLYITDIVSLANVLSDNKGTQDAERAGVASEIEEALNKMKEKMPNGQSFDPMALFEKFKDTGNLEETLGGLTGTLEQVLKGFAPSKK